MKTMTCIEDLRQTYHAKVPRAFVDYCESGSYAEQTLHAIVSWGRYAEVFAYDDESERFSLENPGA